MRFQITAFPTPKGINVDTNLLGQRGLAQPELSSESGNLPCGKVGSRGRLGRFRNVAISGRFIDAEHLSELFLGKPQANAKSLELPDQVAARRQGVVSKK